MSISDIVADKCSLDELGSMFTVLNLHKIEKHPIKKVNVPHS